MKNFNIKNFGRNTSCRNCSEGRIVKNGLTKKYNQHGVIQITHQRYLCKNCNYHFEEPYKKLSPHEQLKKDYILIPRRHKHITIKNGYERSLNYTERRYFNSHKLVNELLDKKVKEIESRYGNANKS